MTKFQEFCNIFFNEESEYARWICSLFNTFILALQLIGAVLLVLACFAAGWWLLWTLFLSKIDLFREIVGLKKDSPPPKRPKKLKQKEIN